MRSAVSNTNNIQNQSKQKKQKATRISDYLLNSSVHTSKRFDELKNIPNEEDEVKKTTNTPAIFMKNVEKNPLTELLNRITKDNYELIFNFDQVKLQLKTTDGYTIIAKVLR